MNFIDKKKAKHMRIERERRARETFYYKQLCSLIPKTNDFSKRLDKLTTLRMASAYARQLNSANTEFKPSFLTDQQVKQLIFEAANGFLFVAQCTTGEIVYVSDAIQPILSYQPNEWFQQSLFDFIHVDDLQNVKKQLSIIQESNNFGRLSSELGSNRRCAFMCRLRVGNSYNYANVQITGYTKSWSMKQEVKVTLPSPNQFCLIATACVEKNLSVNSLNTEFNLRIDQNGFLTSADQHVTQILGYQPNEMLKHHICEFCVVSEQNELNEYLKKVFVENIKDTKVVHLTASNQEVLSFKLNAYSFINPCTENFEFIVCTFTLQKSNSSSVVIGNLFTTIDSATTSNNPIFATTSSTDNTVMETEYPPSPIDEPFDWNELIKFSFE